MPQANVIHLDVVIDLLDRFDAGVDPRDLFLELKEKTRASMEKRVEMEKSPVGQLVKLFYGKDLSRRWSATSVLVADGPLTGVSISLGRLGINEEADDEEADDEEGFPFEEVRRLGFEVLPEKDNISAIIIDETDTLYEQIIEVDEFFRPIRSSDDSADSYHSSP